MSGKRTAKTVEGWSLASELLGTTFAQRVRDSMALSEEGRNADLDLVLEVWIEGSGSVEELTEETGDGNHLGVIVRRWHVAISGLRWSALTLVPLVLGNIRLGRGLSPTDVHGLLTSLESVVTHLSESELQVVTRLREQGKTFDGSTLEMMCAGMSPADSARIAEILSDLCARGVIAARADGVFEMIA